MHYLTTAYILKRMAENGEVHHAERRHWVKIGEHIVSIIDQAGHALCLRVRKLEDKDDPQSDYTAGVYANSWPQVQRFLRIA